MALHWHLVGVFFFIIKKGILHVLCSVLTRLCFHCTAWGESVESSSRESRTSAPSAALNSKSVLSVSRHLGVAGVPLQDTLGRGYVWRAVWIIPQGWDPVWKMTSDKVRDTDQVSHFLPYFMCDFLFENAIKLWVKLQFFVLEIF